MSESISNISKLEVTCKQCDTVITLDIGKSIDECPCCNRSINETSCFKNLESVLKTFRSFNHFEFSLICEKDSV